jgi:hypothetical protein
MREGWKSTFGNEGRHREEGGRRKGRQLEGKKGGKKKKEVGGK